MTRVICSNYDCLHCDKYSYHCQKDIVAVGEDYTYGCEDYISYLDSDEYKEKFYKAVKTKDGKVAKAVDYGKKIEFNGRVFFTTDKVYTGGVNEDESYTVTEERTGYLIGNFARLKDYFEKFLELENKIPDVASYPLAVLKGGKYVLADKGGEEE
jgi:hypothetical protein